MLGGQKEIIHSIVWPIHSTQGHSLIYLFIVAQAVNCFIYSSSTFANAHFVFCRYYSAKWLAAGDGRVPPHKDLEVTAMRNKCMKKFFPIAEDLARAREEFSRFSTCSEEFNDHDSINDRWVGSAMSWWTNHGVSIPLLQSLAIKLVSQPASSSCCERNWSMDSSIVWAEVN